MLGIILPIISLGGILLSIMVNPWFSLSNNALSDMGSIRNPIGYVFNTSLILTGVLGIIFGVKTFNKRLTTPLFTLGMACLTLVGVFPEEYRPHGPCALLFYIFLFSDMALKGFELFTKKYRAGLFWVAAPPATFLLMLRMSRIFKGIAIPELAGAFLIYAWIGFTTLRVYRMEENEGRGAVGFGH